MMLSRYKSDVSDAYASLTKAMRHAYDYRAFDRPSDDPLAATQTFDIHYQTNLNNDYAANISNLSGEANTADKVLMSVESILTQADSTTALGSILKSVDGGTNPQSRQDLAKQLLNYRDSIVAAMNTKYTGNYLFSGSGGTTPFQLVKDPGGDASKDKLYYRGVDVDTGKMKDGSTPTVSLDQLAGEKVYVDIGLGMTVTNGVVDDQSAYNKAMTGISYLGYGKNSDGIENNICSILSKVAGILQGSAGEQSLSTSEQAQIKQYTDAFDVSENNLISGQVQLGNNIKNMLNSTSNYISQMNDSLTEKDDQVEYVDYTDAIEDYYSQLYCYNASLKVGEQVMQQSLMDYLK